MRLTRVIADLEPGGAQLHVLRLARALVAHGITTNVLAGHVTPDGWRLAEAAGVTVDAWDAPHRLQYEPDPGFAAWLEPRLAHADVVHAHMFGAWWAAARAAPAATPLVGSEHNPLRWPGAERGDELCEGLRRVDLFFAHGRQATASVRAAGLPGARVREGRSPVVGFDAVPRRDLPPRRIVFSGRLHPDKGPDVLLEAVARLRAAPPTYVLGSGPEGDALRARAAALGLARTVRFVGWQDEPAPWVAGAAVFVQPSRDEAWSQSAVLALGLGVPVVGTDVDDLPLTLADGRGIVVAAEDPDALAAALRGVLEGRLSTDLEAARAYARRYELPRIAEYYASAYDQLRAQPSRAGSVHSPSATAERDVRQT